MSEEKNEKKNSQAKKVFYWDDEQPNIGVCITHRTGKRGDFLSFEPLRSYRQKKDGELKMRYTHSFTEEQAEAFGNVIVWALSYMRANEPINDQDPEQTLLPEHQAMV